MRRLILILLLALSTAASACPLCKDSVPSSDAQSAGGLPGGFNNSVYFMLLGLMGVLGMITLTLIKGARSTQPTRGRTGFSLK